VIDSSARDALSLRLVLREPAADECAAALLSGLRWPSGTSVRLVNRRPNARSRAGDARGHLVARLGRAGLRVADETPGRGPAIGPRRAADLVITGASRTSGGLRRFLTQSLVGRELPVLVARGPRLDRCLIVVQEDLSPALADLLRREPFCRAHFRVLGVVDVSVPWYAGLAFSPTELLESVTAATNDGHALLKAATRKAALTLSWAGVAARAQVEEGNLERSIVRVAHDMAADWVVLARSLDRRERVLSMVDQLVTGNDQGHD